MLEPKKGFYDSHVLLLDFASLYPSARCVEAPSLPWYASWPSHVHERGFFVDFGAVSDGNAPRRSIIQEYDLCFTTVDWAPVAKRMEARASGESDAKKARTEDDVEVEEAVLTRRLR